MQVYDFIPALFMVASAAAFEPLEAQAEPDGNPTDITNHPYQVAFLHQRYGYLCSGAIIHPTAAVIAGHCVHNPTMHRAVFPEEVWMLAGATDYKLGTRYDVLTYTLHPNYDGRKALNDIAVLRPVVPFVENGVTLQRVPISYRSFPAGTSAVVSGWGVDENGVPAKCLKDAVVLLLDLAMCARLWHGEVVRVGNLCTWPSKHAVCRGDSGAPLVVQGELVGLVSFGGIQGCGNKPAVYTDVLYHINFVRAATQDVPFIL